MGKNAYSSLSQNKTRLAPLLFFLLVLLLPTQLGKHFWPDFSYLLGFRIDYLSPTLFLTDVIAGLLFVMVFLAREMRSTFFGFLQTHKTYFTFLVVFLVINTLVATSLPLAIYGDIKLLECIFIGVYVACFITQKTFSKIPLLLVASGALESVLAIWQYIIQHSVGGLFYFLGERQFSGQTPGIANANIAGQLVLRPYGTLPHPNVLAAFLLTALVLAVPLFVKKQSVRKTVGIIAFLGIASIALLLSLSRTAIFLWVVLMVMWILRIALKKGLRKKTIILVGLLLVICLIVLGLFFPHLLSRFLGTRFNESAVTTRLLLFQEGWKVFFHHILFGVGLKNMLPALVRLSPQQYPWQIQPVHMMYLVVLVEGGVAGGILFFWFLVGTLRRALCEIRQRSVLFPAALSLLCLLFLGLFDHYAVTLQQGQLLLALFLGSVWIRK